MKKLLALFLYAFMTLFSFLASAFFINAAEYSIGDAGLAAGAFVLSGLVYLFANHLLFASYFQKTYRLRDHLLFCSPFYFILAVSAISLLMAYPQVNWDMGSIWKGLFLIFSISAILTNAGYIVYRNRQPLARVA